MNSLARFFIVFAVAFSVTGDYFLKRYGDDRRGWDLFWCLTLWEVCALAWVVAYRQNIPLGRSTVFGQAIVVAANVAIGALIFSEHMRALQWFGAACVLVGILLVGS
jgi:multidrug transporter EmrE-like cation transporter